jgi:hypothetical protein
MKDGKLVNADPTDVIGHVSVPFPEWMAKMPFA